MNYNLNVARCLMQVYLLLTSVDCWILKVTVLTHTHAICSKCSILGTLVATGALCTYILGVSCFLHCAHMCSRVMCLVVLVCVWVCDQKIDLFSTLLLKKSCLVYYTTCTWNLTHLRSGFLHPASCIYGAIHACSIIVGFGILYYGMPHLKALSH